MSAALPRVKMLTGDEAHVFATHHHALRAAVRAAVRGPEACIEDACSFAWLQFLRCQPDRDHAFAWLRTVAIREAWHQVRQQHRNDHLDHTPEPQHPGPSLDETIEARHLLQAVSELPDRQRHLLTLAATGHTHAEIQTATRTTGPTIKRQLAKARRHLQAIRDPTS